MKSVQQDLLDKEHTNWTEHKKMHKLRLSIIGLVPPEVTSVQFISEDSYYMHHTYTLEDLLKQIAEWDSLKPELMDYNLFCDSSVAGRFVLSSGLFLRIYCTDIQGFLDHFTSGDCVITEVQTTTKRLKCMRAQ